MRKAQRYTSASLLTLLVLVVAACGSPANVGPGATATSSPTSSSTTGSQTAAGSATTSATSVATTQAPSTSAPAYSPCEPWQADNDRIEFAPHWEPGEAIQLERTESRDRSGGSPDAGSSTSIDVTVLESNSSGFVLSWELGETIIDTGAISFPDDDLLAEFLELAQIRFEYTTDPAGAYLGLRNLDEVRDRLGQAIDLLAELPGMDPAVLEETRAVALSDQSLQAGAAQDIVAYHSLYGRSVNATRPEVEETLLTNLFGGEPFPATKTTKVITTRDNQGCVVVEVTETPDPERFVEILFDTLFPAGSEPSAEDRAEVESFQIVNKALFVYDHGSGRIRHVTAEQTTSTVSAFRTDVVTIVETNR